MFLDCRRFCLAAMGSLTGNNVTGRTHFCLTLKPCVQPATTDFAPSSRPTDGAGVAT